MQHINEATLAAIEKQHPSGITSAEILGVFADHEIPFSEATLRKYVQLGLLPRSIRVGRKGKHQGSQGLYPPSVIRQILHIKRMMAESLTIEQIQREFLFMRSDLEQLQRTLGSIFSKLNAVLREGRREGGTRTVARQIGDARALSHDLVARLEAIEAQLVSCRRLEHVAVS
jgi:DNA-binding transcriptional MerR regulator